MTHYRLNEDKNGVEIVFDAKPAEEVRATLKAAGFRWGKGYWYAIQTPERLKLAEEITAQTAPSVDPSEYHTTAAPGYMGATEYTGSKYAGLYGAELAAAIRAALKECHIYGCSVSKKTFSGGQEISVKVKASEADFITAEEYADKEQGAPRRYWYTDTNGEQIHRDAMPWSDPDKCREIIRHTAILAYNSGKRSAFGEWGADFHNISDMLSAPFCEKISAIKRVLAAFNHEDNNGMVDYFDQHFYEEIKIKAA